jgi:hypothetical protein
MREKRGQSPFPRLVALVALLFISSAARAQSDERVRELEGEISTLREKIARAKARLLMLQENVLGGDLSTQAQATLVHRNEMSSTFVLESISYTLDGTVIFNRSDSSGELAKKQELEIFNGRILPGQHQVTVKLQYRGHGFGVFSYLDGYRFKVSSSYTFNAEPGRITSLRVIGYERGGFNADLKDRPAVRYDVDVIRSAQQAKGP